MPALVMALSDPDMDVRRNSAVALGRLGTIAGDAIPALERALRDRVEKVRSAAASSIDRIKTSARKAA
jgi:HEAT repeat protein